MAEEIKKGNENPAELPAKLSEDAFVEIEGIKYKEDPNNKGQSLKDGQGNPVPFIKKEDSIDYKTEFEKKKKEIEERDKQIEQAGFNIQNLKKKLKEAGIPLDEEKALTSEKAQEIIREEIKNQVGGITEKFETKLSEVIRSLNSKGNRNPSGSGAGQKPPIQVERPKLSPQDEQLLRVSKLVWSSEKKGFVAPSGRIYPYISGKGIVSPLGEVAPLKKE